MVYIAQFSTESPKLALTVPNSLANHVLQVALSQIFKFEKKNFCYDFNNYYLDHLYHFHFVSREQ